MQPLKGHRSKKKEISGFSCAREDIWCITESEHVHKNSSAVHQFAAEDMDFITFLKMYNTFDNVKDKMQKSSLEAPKSQLYLAITILLLLKSPSSLFIKRLNTNKRWNEGLCVKAKHNKNKPNK